MRQEKIDFQQCKNASYAAPILHGCKSWRLFTDWRLLQLRAEVADNFTPFFTSHERQEAGCHIGCSSRK